MLFECLLENKIGFLEAKAFRNEHMVEKYAVKELSEILFAMMLTLHLMGQRKEVQNYCRKSLKFPRFDHIFLSSTDLSNVISTLRNAKTYLGKPNVDVPINELKQYLRNIVLNKNTPKFSRAFFMKLQTRLRIKDASLLILRRQIVDGDGYRDDVSLGKPLYQQLCKYRNNCDVLALLQTLMDNLTESKLIVSEDSKKNLVNKIRNIGISLLSMHDMSKDHEDRIQYWIRRHNEPEFLRNFAFRQQKELTILRRKVSESIELLKEINLQEYTFAKRRFKKATGELIESAALIRDNKIVNALDKQEHALMDLHRAIETFRLLHEI